MGWTGQRGGVMLMLMLVLAGCGNKGPEKAAERPQTPPVVEELPAEAARQTEPNHLALARDLMRQGHHEVALVQLNAVKHTAGDPEIPYLRGVCYRETNRPQEAAQAFAEALKQQSGFAPAHNGLGLVYQQQERGEEALAAFRKAIALDPARSDFYNNLGYALMKSHQYEEAAQALAQSLALDSSSQMARNNLALCALYRNNETEALRVLLAGNSEWVAYHNLAVLHRMTGRPDKAIIMERKAAELRHPTPSGTPTPATPMPAAPTP